ncbi:MAG: glycosyltransferase [Rhizobiaceae bacterium]|nr:glycosyltransferase [Rhizobiaceae bacterium]
MQIVFLVASAQDRMCGVADYTGRLAAALGDVGASVTVEYLDSWSLRHIMEIRRRYAGRKDVVFHLQYPSLSIGKSVSPGFLPLLLPNTFVTLHEFRIFHILRKMVFLLPSLLARAVIFSNDEERSLFARYFPWSRKRLMVIPIGNNIPRLAPGKAPSGPERIVYFGQISRNKGIEFFIDTIARMREGGSVAEARMIGALVETDTDFVDYVRNSAGRLGIELKLNLSPEAVSETLSEATIALLPFPDGVSNKRGSALACLDHGVCVLTTHTERTPEWLAEVTYPVTSPDDAAAMIGKIVHGEIPRVRSPLVLEREMAARDWHAIAREHLRIYQQTVR